MRKKVEKNTATKKTVEKKAVSAVKAVEPEVQSEETSEMKAAEVASEAKPEVNEAEIVSEVKAEEKPAAKKTGRTTTASKKATKTAKKETEAKAVKTTKASTSQKIILQMSGREELSVENIINRVKDAYVAEGHSAASIKNIEVYIKPEEGMAYYVIDDYASGISLY